MARDDDLADLARWFEAQPHLAAPTIIKLGGQSPRATGKASLRGIKAALEQYDDLHLVVTNDWLRLIKDFGEIRAVVECPRWDTSKRPPWDRAGRLDRDNEVA